MARPTYEVAPLEAQEQALWFKWTEFVHLAPGNHLLRDHCWAVPNGGSRHPTEAARMKAQGITPGIADITIAIPAGKHHGLFIEMKRRGERASSDQLEHIELRRTMGYQALVAQGFDEARIEAIQYLTQSWRVIDRWVG